MSRTIVTDAMVAAAAVAWSAPATPIAAPVPPPATPARAAGLAAPDEADRLRASIPVSEVNALVAALARDGSADDVAHWVGIAVAAHPGFAAPIVSAAAAAHPAAAAAIARAAVLAFAPAQQAAVAAALIGHAAIAAGIAPASIAAAVALAAPAAGRADVLAADAARVSLVPQPQLATAATEPFVAVTITPASWDAAAHLPLAAATLSAEPPASDPSRAVDGSPT